jgi:hypothetical protein
LEHHLENGGSSAKEKKNQHIHCVPRPDQLVTSAGEPVQVMAMKLEGKPIAISATKIRTMPLIKFN